MLHHPVDASDDLRDVDGAGAAADLDADDPRVRRHTLEAAGGAVIAGDDAGDRGAVPEVVDVSRVRVLGVEGQVGSEDHLVGAVETGDRGDTGVEHGDVDTRTGGCVVPRRRRADDLLNRRQIRQRRRGGAGRNDADDATGDCDGEVRRGAPQQDPAPKGCAFPCDPASCCGGLAHSALPTRDTGGFSGYWRYRIMHAERPNP